MIQSKKPRCVNSVDPLINVPFGFDANSFTPDSKGCTSPSFLLELCSTLFHIICEPMSGGWDKKLGGLTLKELFALFHSL